MHIVNLAILATLANTEQGADYFARPAGSMVLGLDTSNGLATATWLGGLAWIDVTDLAIERGCRFGACRYFQASIPEGFEGMEGIRLASELTDEELANVRLVKGHHGAFEFQLAGLEPKPTRLVHIIVGNVADFPTGVVTDETAGIVTWYPGRLTPAVDLGSATVKAAR